MDDEDRDWGQIADLNTSKNQQTQNMNSNPNRDNRKINMIMRECFTDKEKL